MIVESLGTSGSGKSALIPILTQLLSGEGWLAMSATEAIHYYMRKTSVGRLICCLFPPLLRGPILWRVFSCAFSNWHSFWFAGKYPRLVGYLVMHQLRRQLPWSHRLLILRLYFVMTGWVQFIRHNAIPGQIIFLDEGFVHRATHLFVSEAETPDPEQVMAYLQLIPPPDLVLWVSAPVDLCLSRVYARGVQVRLAHLSTSAARQFLSNGERVCHIAAEYGKTMGWPIIEVDNVDDLGACALKLRQDVIQNLS